MNKHLQASQPNNFEDLQEVKLEQPNWLPYLRTLRRKALLIFGIAGLTTFAVFLNTLRQPLSYGGDFRLLIEPLTSTDKLTDPSTITRTEGIPNEDLLSVDYPTQVAILRGEGMLLSIAKEIQAGNPEANINKLMKKLEENLSVQRVGDTRRDETKIIEVAYTDIEPELTKQVLEVTAQKFISYSAEEQQKRIDAGVKFIDKQLSQLQEELFTLQAQQKQLQKEYQLIEPSTRGQELFSQVHELTQQQREVARQFRELNALQNRLQKRLNLTPSEALVALTLNQDPNRVALLEKLQEIEREIAITSARFRSNTPVLQEFKEQQQNLIDLLNQKTQQLLDQISIPVDSNSPALEYQDPTRLSQIQQLVDTTNQIEELRSRYQSLTASKEKVAEQAEQFPEIASQYREVEEQIGLTNQIVNRLKSQREILRLEISQNKMPWELVSEPQINRDVNGDPEATATDRNKQLLAGIVGGMLLGSIVALLVEKRRDVFYDSEDIPDKVSVPLLETIPFVGEKFKGSYPQKSLPFVNAIESLYTKLCLTYTNPSIQSLVVASVEPNENQSIVAFNLAQVAAAMGNQVILIDADSQNSQFRHPLNINDKGDSEHSLRKDSDSGEVIRSSQVDNLSVLTLGVSLRKTGKRLWSNQIKQLMKAWQEKYDLVIYNGPPLSQSTDINFLAAHTDGIMLVSEINKSKYSLVEKSIKQLNDYNLNVLGVVAIKQALNQKNSSNHNVSEQYIIDEFRNPYNNDLYDKFFD